MNVDQMLEARKNLARIVEFDFRILGTRTACAMDANPKDRTGALPHLGILDSENRRGCTRGWDGSRSIC